jgi:hypothetical protein
MALLFSVIISAPDVPTIPRFESEEQSVLLIHSNAVKTIQIAPQSFQAVRWWTSQILERHGGVHQVQFYLDSLP